MKVCTLQCVYLLPGPRGVADLVRLDVLHDADGCHHQFDSLWRVSHGLHYGHIRRLEGGKDTAPCL